ncbi:hypothetical protein R1flu_001765 [Riccia fluitans]|uniref:Ribosomal protein S16 n=1 Tax=Riccia fluitans TaxID=41844 RepID=A0ABD1Y4Q0_9MARC
MRLREGPRSPHIVRISSTRLRTPGVSATQYRILQNLYGPKELRRFSKQVIRIRDPYPEGKAQTTTCPLSKEAIDFTK